jgi:hypothetical protein
VVARDDGELPRLGERAEEVGGALELAGLAGEGQVAGDDEMVDRDLAQRVEEPLGELRGVLLALLRGEAVARVAAAVGDVQVADVAEADDGVSRCRTPAPRRCARNGAPRAGRWPRGCYRPLPRRSNRRPRLAVPVRGLMER